MPHGGQVDRRVDACDERLEQIHLLADDREHEKFAFRRVGVDLVGDDGSAASDTGPDEKAR